LYIVSIDGETGAITMDEEIQLILPPGEHKLFVSYGDVSVNSGTWGNTTTYSANSTQSDFVPLSDTFLPGHFYWIDYEISGDNITFILIDETDPAIYYNEKSAQNAAQKRIDAAKKMLLAAADSSKGTAIAAEPTKFEGTWKGSGQVFQFKGNTCTHTVVAPLGTIVTKGTFEFSDKQLKLTSRLNEMTSEWDYAFNPDGTLQLNAMGYSTLLTKE
jgi:hypothetical protein